MTKILLVEDDNNLREIYGARLQAEDYEIVSAADGEEALAVAVKEKPDLIISDVMMPKISGFDMLDILRTTPETKNTKVIMMTALSQPEDRQRGESLGADKYLVKSQVTLEDVVAAVHEILGDGPTPAAPAPDFSQPPEPTPVPDPVAAAATPAPEPSTPSDSPANQTGVVTDNQTDQTVTPQNTASTYGTSDNSSSEPNQSEDGSMDSATPNNDLSQQTPGSAPDPKALGASDAPEPASRKSRVIQPINDLSHEKDHLMQLAAEEEAREAESTPGGAVAPVQPTASAAPAVDLAKDEAAAAELLKQNTTPTETENLAPTTAQEPPADASTPQNQPEPHSTLPQAEQPPAGTLEEQKQEIERELEQMINDGTIDREAAAPPVEANPNSASAEDNITTSDNTASPVAPEPDSAPNTSPQPGDQAVANPPEEPLLKPEQPTQPPAEPIAPIIPPSDQAQPQLDPASSDEAQQTQLNGNPLPNTNVPPLPTTEEVSGQADDPAQGPGTSDNPYEDIAL